MKHFVVTFTHETCVASYGDSEVTVLGHWDSAQAAVEAVAATFGDGYDGAIATEQDIRLFDSDAGELQNYVFDLEDMVWKPAS